MSGGLDSSVAAMLLMEQGYDLVGITMNIWDESEEGVSATMYQAINDARKVAQKFGFPHYVIDVRDDFEKIVISDFITEYTSGRTPNPCVVCNKNLKWEALLKKADELGCAKIATGHYVQVFEKDGRYFPSKGADPTKDQSYFLWNLSQENLKRSLVPLGKFQKSEIREMARERGFEEIAGKRESYEICFIPDNDYRSFLKRKIENLEEKVAGGKFIDKEEKVLGTHKGYPFYTIGQRKGLNVAAGYPLYVLEIRPETNTIVLGKKEDLFRKEMWVTDFNFSKYKDIPKDYEVITKIRYRSEGGFSRINLIDEKIKVEFYEEVSAITPGQSAVFYEGNDVVGGGLIK